jgi:hypothetical protein
MRSFTGHILNIIMKYHGVSLLVREAIYPESLHVLANTKLQGSHHLNLIIEYLGVSLLVREAVYPESLPVPASTKLLIKAPSQPYHEIPWCESPCSGGSLPRIPP